MHAAVPHTGSGCVRHHGGWIMHFNIAAGAADSSTHHDARMSGVAFYSTTWLAPHGACHVVL